MAMPRATVEDVMSWGPCDGYDREYVEALWDGRESLSALEILDLDIPPGDRLWAMLREVLVPARILHEFACRVAEHILLREREMGCEPDPRSWAAIAAKRDWVAGRIGREELRTAREAARNAAWEAAEDAAWAAAEAAAWAAEDAAWEAARDVERADQLEILRELLKEEVE